MYCPKCGTENDQDSAFCVKCGENLTSAEPAKEVQVKKNHKKTALLCCLIGIVVVAVVLMIVFLGKGSNGKTYDLPLKINWGDTYQTVMKKDKNANEPKKTDNTDKLRDKRESIDPEWCQLIGFSESYGKVGDFEYVYDLDGKLDAVNLTWIGKSVDLADFYGMIVDNFTWDDPTSTSFAWSCRGRNEKVEIIFLAGTADNLDILVTPLKAEN